MKQFSLILSMVFLTFTTVFAQITGTVTDDSGEALIGANVIVKGTNDVGTVTEFDGTYSISAKEGDVIVVSYTGYTDMEQTVGASSVLDFQLSEGVVLQEAVVTALGVSKDEKSLGYAVQKVDGGDFVQARESNIVNALNGKVAGVHITNSSGAIGGSTRILLRGATSMTGNNQPLFVIDGVPIDNGNYGTSGSGGGFDLPNGIADVNPDDIESVSVLKGPNAAALYGVRAANGVIVITTKTGAKRKGIGISFNSSTTFETPLVLPDFQNSYGQGGNADFFEFVDGSNGDGGVDESWGPALDAGLEFVQWNSFDGNPLPWVSNPNNVKDFYDTGVSANNNVSFTGGNDAANFRLSLGTSQQKGIVPNTEFQKYNVTGSSNVKLAEKVTASLSVNYIKSVSGNLPTGGYNNENPVQQMIWSGRQVDFTQLKDYQNLPLAAAGTPAEGTPANWNTLFQNNPYWVLDNNLNQLDKDRVIGNVRIQYDITDWLSASVKTGTDAWSSFVSSRKAQGSNENPEGYYAETSRRVAEINTEALISFDKALSDDFNLQLNLGGNQMRRNSKLLFGEAAQLELPNLYNLSNIKSGVSPTLINSKSEQRINSIYTFGQIAYKRALYLDFSLRNDWASVLPTENNSFMYPSVTLSAVISDLVDMNNDVLSFLKVRGGWSKVGSTGVLAPYSLQQAFSFRDSPWGSVSLAYDPATLNNPNLKPESTTGIEFGLDIRLLQDKIRLDATYYTQTSKDLIVPVEVSASSGYINTLDNVGEMKNSGIELQLGFTPFKNDDWKIDLDFNFAKNKNEVVSLGGLETLVLGGQWDVNLEAREGMPYGVLFGPAFARNDAGQIIYSDGLPTIDTENKILGNIQPDWTGGVIFNVSYKGIGLNTIIDAKVGGAIHSMTVAWGRYAGVLEETLAGRETGIVGVGVMNMGTDENPVWVDNNVVTSAESWNKRAYQNSVAESSVFDATYVKWRQVMLSYRLPKKFVDKTPFTKAEIAFVGRNLAILHRKAPHIDPESAFSSANGEQGQEFGQLPSTRSLGFNINFSF